MKKYITTISFTKISILVFMFLTTLVNAQTDLPDAPEDEPSVAPIDGYVFILAVVGLVYVFLTLQALARQRCSRA